MRSEWTVENHLVEDTWAVHVTFGPEPDLDEEMECVETGGHFRVSGLVAPAFELYAAGVRMIGIEHVSGPAELKEGYRLRR